jgi:hypothetical protein
MSLCISVHSRDDDRGLQLVTVFEAHAGRLAVANDDFFYARLGAQLAAGGLECARNRLGHGTHTTTREAPRTDVAIDFAHVVVQQDVGRARRVHPEGRADDAAARLGGLDYLGLEILVEVLGHAHGPEADRLVHAILAHLPELAADVQKLEQVFRLERGRVGRRGQQEVANEPALAHRVRSVDLVHVGIAP